MLSLSLTNIHRYGYRDHIFLFILMCEVNIYCRAQHVSHDFTHFYSVYVVVPEIEHQQYPS